MKRKTTRQLVWEALEQQNHQTVLQLAKIISRTDTAIYVALKSFVAAGFISRHKRNPLNLKGSGREYIYSIISTPNFK
jgi:predicted transcriptional regulator